MTFPRLFALLPVSRIPLVLILAVASFPASADELPNPYPRAVFVGEQVLRWDFAAGAEDWRAVNQCELAAHDGLLTVRSSGNDPYLAGPAAAAGSEFIVRLRIKSQTDGAGQIFWSSTKHPGSAAERVADFPMTHDGQWHEYDVRLAIDGDLTGLRLDPGSAPGEVQIDWIAVHRGGLHPLEIVAVEQTADAVNVRLRNHSDQTIEAALNGSSASLAARSERNVPLPVTGRPSLAAMTIRVDAPDLAPISRTVWVHRVEAPIDAVTRTIGGLTIEAARDGAEVRLRRHGQLVAAVAPLVHVGHTLPPLKLAQDTWPLQYTGDGLSVSLDVNSDGDLSVQITAARTVEGPLVRSYGALEQGLFAGVEYLGKGEHSSSTLDIETPEHLRYEPDPMKVTMPLMATVTDRASVAVAWDDMTLQPVFAVPDFLDGTGSHHLALKGKSIQATIRVGDGWDAGGRLEPLILWAVQRRGLPPLPAEPRSFEEQMKLSLAAYSGMVYDEKTGGYYHAVVPGRRELRGGYFADHASAIWRITGQVPDLPRLQFGGAHVANHASYFVSGRAADWLRTINGMAEGLIRAQQSDGSYRYDGTYRRGHFEDTASGICSRPAYQLLEHAYYTGSQESLAAALKTLEFMKRFRTPRGAQTWEVPLHTPDILASGQAVWAYVRAYQLTGDRTHLAEARRWAVTGLPFVYQWSNQPIMLYATTPVYGATHWKAPNWIGLPVQWCGTVYAYGLLLLAPYDDTLDWKQVAEGILICGEQMQYPDGPSVGCLPDVFELKSQRRRPADINPGALVSLRLLVAGKLDSLSVATDGKHRVVAPFPVTLRDGAAHIVAQPGVKYQVLIDGARIVDVTSQGQDTIPLDAGTPRR